MSAEFVHLHVHSQYSLGQSTLRLNEMICRTSRMGMPAIAITDPNLFGAMSFYKQAKNYSRATCLCKLCIAERNNK